MIHLLSPSKSLDFKSVPITKKFTIPEYLEHSEKLVHKLKTYSLPALEKLMGISHNLAELNVDRFKTWKAPLKLSEIHKQAILAFTGDVYIGLKAKEFQQKDFDFAQDHLRILSGLYGLLKPLDLIAPYRLEMGTDLKIGRNKNLYEFWGNKLTEDLNNELNNHTQKTVINLASNEYFKVINKNKLNGELVQPVFKDAKNGEYKIIAIYAKKARGLMSNFIIKNKISKAEDLKSFNIDNYNFNNRLSSDREMIFTREEGQAK